MRRACTILLTCALLTALARPLAGPACCSQAQCCGSEFCPMKAKAQPAAKPVEQTDAKPAENEMQCHKAADALAPSAPKQSGNCAMKANACGRSDFSWNLPNGPRAILQSPAVLPGPQLDRDEVISFIPAAFPGFNSPPLQPPRG